MVWCVCGICREGCGVVLNWVVCVEGEGGVGVCAG